MFKVQVRWNRPVRLPPSVHQPRLLNNFSKFFTHLIPALSHHLQYLVPVVMATGTTKHEQPECVNELHGPNLFVPNSVGEDPKGQRISDKELGVLQDVILGAEGLVHSGHHCILVDDGVDHFVKVLPFRPPFAQLLDGVKLEGDPVHIAISEQIFEGSQCRPNLVMLSKWAMSECSTSSRAWW